MLWDLCVLVVNPRLGSDALGAGVFDAFHFRHQVGELNEFFGRVAAGEDDVF